MLLIQALSRRWNLSGKGQTALEVLRYDQIYSIEDGEMSTMDELSGYPHLDPTETSSNLKEESTLQEETYRKPHSSRDC